MIGRLGCVVFDLDGTLTRPGGTDPVPGIADVLAALCADGVSLAVATSAPTHVARRVLADLGVDRWFASVAGAASNGGLGGKDAVVAEALLGLGRLLPGDAPGTAVVGDGAADMAAALRHDLVPIGAAWGGASEHALRAAGAVAVLHDPCELVALLRAGDPRSAPSSGDAGRPQPGDPRP